MKKKVIFIESNTTGTGEIFVQQVKELGYHPIFITSDISKYSSFFQKETEVIHAQTNNLNDVLRVCKEIYSQTPGIAGVFSSSEYYTHTAAVVAEKHRLSGPSSSAIATARDKYLQRQLLEKGHVPIPLYQKVSTVSEATSGAQTIGYPVVVKPVLSSGSEGVKLCANEASVKEHAEKLFRMTVNSRNQRNPQYILVEELLTGPEFSVESFGDGKTIHVAGVTQKYLGRPPSFVEIGHDYPAYIQEEKRKQIVTTAIEALQAVGLLWGPAHTEIKLTVKGPCIVEINPRLAGGMIPKLVDLAMGIDLTALTAQLFCGQHVQFPHTIKKNCACIRFIIPPSNGTINQITGIDSARNIPYVVNVSIYEKAAQFKELKGDFNDRVGHVISSGASMKDCREAVEKALTVVSFNMNMGGDES